MKILTFVLLLSCSIAYSQPAGYSFGKEVLILASQVSGTSSLTNFPVLISFTDNDLRTTGNGGNVENSNGYDIVFTLPDCSTLLDHQIEKYDATTGEYIAWLKVPSLSNSVNTGIHMYYGNSSIATDPSTNTTWDSNYQGVWHLHDDVLDGTANTINGTNNGSTDAAGKIADGQNFVSASTQYIDLGNPAALNFATSDWTLSAWVRTTSTAQANIVSNGGDNAGGVRYVIAGNEGAANKLTLTTDDNVTKRQSSSSTDINDNTWHYVVGVRDGTTIRTYVDGVAEGTNTLPGGYDLSNTSQQNAYIGCGADQGSSGTIKFFDGDIDETRVSNVFRSPDWIITEYNNQNSPGTFYTISSELSAGLLCSTLPIELLEFGCTVINNRSVKVEWETATENNNDYFTIERSMNTISWEEVIRIDGAGYSSNLLSYSSVDSSPYSGISYYRLKQTDFDGQFEYSQIRRVSIDAIDNLQLFPNPSDGLVYVLGYEFDSQQLKIYNVLGQDVTSLTKQVKKNETSLIIDLSNLSEGIYYIKTKTTTNKVYKQ